MSLRLALAAGLVLSSATATAAVRASGAAAACAHIHDLGSGWTETDPPVTPVNPADSTVHETITQMAVVDGDPKVLLATDTTAIFRSTDGGCTWTTAYQLPEGDHYQQGAGAYSIVGLATSSSPPGKGQQPAAYAVAISTVDLPPLIVASHDGGATWSVPAPSTSPDAVPPKCTSYETPPDVAVVPAAHQQTLYLSCWDTESSSSIAVTRDGGSSWQSLTVPSPVRFGSLRADPNNAQVLWWLYHYPTTGTPSLPVLWRSSDAGATWSQVRNPAARSDPFTGAFSLTVGTYGGKTLLAMSGGMTTYASLDSGSHWTALQPPPPGPISMLTFTEWFVGRSLYIARSPQHVTDPECTPNSSGGKDPVYRYSTPTSKAVVVPEPPAFAFWGNSGAANRTVLTGGPVATALAFPVTNGKCDNTYSIVSYQAH